MMVEDEVLYHRFLTGDENALRKLIERHGSRLALFIAGYTHDLEEAEDLMLEAFARMVVKKPRFDDGHGFRAYLYKIGRNLALRQIAKEHRKRAFSLDDLGEELESAELLEDIFQLKERDRILHLSMQQIPPDYCEVLYLLYFEELSYHEAATVMHKSEKQIANLVYRGKQALRPILEKEEITDAQY